MNQVLMVIMAAGAVVGGIDRIMGNKWGYGAKFEEGFQFLGSTALSMAGMICLAPVLADVLGKIIVPLYRMIGVDPGMFGSLLAIDMGGYQLAKELAVDAQIGRYAGIVAASIFGCTVVFTIPVGMGMIREEDRGCFAKGIMIGLVTIPAGLAAGGALAGLSVSVCIRQNLPILVLALLLMLGLWKMPMRMIRGFCVFAKGIHCVITVGLVLGAVEYMCGIQLVKGMTPLTEAMEVVAAIGIVMLGSLPVVEFLQRILRKPFCTLGKWVGMDPAGMTGLLVGAVSAIPAISMYGDMDERGKIVNAAFLVSAASMLSAHMGFTLSTEPELLGALIGAKICGGAAAVLLAFAVNGKRAGTENAEAESA
ncbi:MAG: ethanolamine utilization protein EutH [Lachnospiraceae bacterium]|nr:ethanolamine utilization protein EutH [Lachnospiraceae bacterium]